jgi:uncharacterized membrane protein YgcG
MRVTSSRLVLAAATLSLTALAGCDQIDPLKRPYMWEATGINAHNIAAMAANPADLTMGRDSTRHRAVVETDGVERLWTGKPLPLLSGGSASGGSGGASASGGASGGTSGGGT